MVGMTASAVGSHCAAPRRYEGAALGRGECHGQRCVEEDSVPV